MGESSAVIAMTTDSVEARLRDIEARCAVATKGNWGLRDDGIGAPVSVHTYYDRGKSSARVGEVVRWRDADFIAHAGGDDGDLAWLVALVRRYRGALGRIGTEDEPIADDGYCLHAADCFGKRGNHTESCPWRIAREALNEEVPP